MTESAIELHYRESGDPEGQPLILLHGLFGSSANWMGIARRLESDWRIIIPDLRNHGRSPHADSMSYPRMAEDLVALMDRLEISTTNLVGHSMGGKLAMVLAVQNGERVNKLVVADAAPVGYAHRFDAIFSGLQAIRLDLLTSRQEAEQILAESVASNETRQYLLQNLAKQSGAWSWRFNLAALASEIETIAGFPELAGQSFPGDVLFIYGGNSSYVQAEYLPAIREVFPFARMRMLAGAGHWVYAEQPEQFTQAMKTFLKTGEKS
ncbi:MAG: alpha/beta fold hydrolase [Pseudomonadota bacterium]